jgi:hypothetical protein
MTSVGARSEPDPPPSAFDDDENPVSGELEQEIEAAPEVLLRWDPFRPERLHVVDGLPESPGTGAVDPGAQVWRRLAAVRALDRLLHLPLSRALLDADVAAAMVSVAETPRTPTKLRDALLDEALRAARGASPRLVRYLSQLAGAGDRPPPPLVAALRRLADAYQKLAKVCEDSDADLDAVIEVWGRLETAGTAAAAARDGGQPVRTLRQLHAPGRDFLDPLLLPARVLGFSARADVPDVRLATGSAPARVTVVVEAFDDSPRLDDIAGMTVRVIDVDSRKVLSFHPLGGPVPAESSTPGGSGHPCFETTVDLPAGVSLSALRFDVQDGGDARVASADELLRARRAFLFLTSWRALVADVRLDGPKADPAAHLRRIVDAALAGDRPSNADAPLWRGGPRVSQLRRLAGLTDEQLAAALSDDAADRILHTACGPGDLLTAELAAAHARRAAL